MISEIFRTYVAGLISPTSLTGILLIIGTILIWKKKPAAKYVFTFATIIFILIATAPLRYVLYESKEYGPVKIPLDYQYVVVLGGKIYPNDKHPTGSQITPSLLSRLALGVSLVNKRPGSKLIVTGNGAGDVPEAHLMARFANEMGIPSDRIIAETKSLNTKDHPQFLAPLIRKEKFVIVTSAFHMKRALINFRDHGMEGYPAPTDYTNKKAALDLESLIMRGENFSALDKWMTEFYSTMWTYTRKVFGL